MPRGRSPSPGFYGTRLLVRDFSRSFHFYRARVGLTPNKGHGAPPYGEFVWDGRACLAVFDRRAMAAAVGLAPGRTSNRGVGRPEVVLSVTDVDRFARELTRRKVLLLRGPTDRPPWGLRTIHFQDPDGYLVEVSSPMEMK